LTLFHRLKEFSNLSKITNKLGVSRAYPIFNAYRQIGTRLAHVWADDRSIYMGKTQVTLLMVIFSGAISFAQGSAVVAEAKKEVASESAAAQSTQSSAPATAGDVVIVTQQSAAPAVAQQPVIEQPTTVVTASPLTASRAEELRKTRERMEIETEQKIVERLETSRLEDEKKRVDNLFGNKLEQQAAPAVVAPLAPAAPVKSEEQLKSEIASQVRADLDAAKDAEEAKKEKARWSVGGVLATLDYPDAYNVGSDFGAGIAFNWIGPDRIVVELAAIFSQATIDESYSLYKEVDQQNWTVASKYLFMKREFSPVVGGLASFTHREYTDMYQWGYNSTASGVNSATTDALDVGILLGVQFAPSKNITFGLDYRWLTNIETRYSDPSAFNRALYQNYSKDFRPLEEIDYQFINMSMNFMF
jgi:hypothetical protein